MSDQLPEHPSPALVVRRSADGHAGAFAMRTFEPGAVLSPFGIAFRRPKPSRHTLQVGLDLHIEIAPTELAFINHGCDPNVAFDVDRSAVVVLRPVRPGDELRFFYPSTEWDMHEPFACHCAAAACIGTVRGARWLRADQFPPGPVAPHIRRLLAERG